MANTDYCFDVWTVRRVAVDDFGEDHWDEDDSTDYRELGNNDSSGAGDDGPSIEDFDDDNEFGGSNSSNHSIITHLLFLDNDDDD